MELLTISLTVAQLERLKPTLDAYREYLEEYGMSTEGLTDLFASIAFAKYYGSSETIINVPFSLFREIGIV
jgi:hypothetical protein